MKHLKSTFGGLLALTAAASNAFAQGPPPPPDPAAHALSSWDCAGWTAKIINTCDNAFAYFHVCYGQNAEFGSENFMVPPRGSRQIHVQKYSTFISSCGVIPPFICPAGMGALPLDHCD